MKNSGLSSIDRSDFDGLGLCKFALIWIFRGSANAGEFTDESSEQYFVVGQRMIDTSSISISTDGKFNSLTPIHKTNNSTPKNLKWLYCAFRYEKFGNGCGHGYI